MEFTTPQALHLLWFIVPLIIIYLIKAKPVDLNVPSLMFFMQQKNVRKYNAFFQKLLLKALFFIQLFFIAFLAVSSAGPVIDFPMDVFSLNTIAVVDVSSSMWVKEGAVTRLDSNKKELLSEIKGKASVILAAESPVVVVRNVSSSRARAIISNLAPVDVPTRIDSSILLANDILGTEKGTILVYSDFLLVPDEDILAAKKISEVNNKRVVFIQAGSPKQNMGFTELNIYRGAGEAYVRNFGETARSVEVKMSINGAEKQRKKMDIEPGSSEYISFDIPQGETTLELAQKDIFDRDDRIYLSNPYKEKINILFITNNKNSNSKLDALIANTQFVVNVAVPPVFPELTHDIVFVSDIAKGNILPNTFKEIKEYVGKGGKVILSAYDGLGSTDGLTGFEVGSAINKEDEACVDIVSAITKGISSPRCFASISKYLEAKVKNNNSIVLASSKSGNPLLISEGGLLYYGIIEGDFEEQVSYPLFWDSLINFMLGREELSNFNYKTGDSILGFNKSGREVLENIGFFESESGRIAVNLLNQQESDITRKSAIINSSDFNETLDKAPVEVNLGFYILLAAAALFLFEIFYIKRRGDL